MKLIVVPDIEHKMATTLYKDSQMRDDLLNLDKTITDQTIELHELKKQNRKIEHKYLQETNSNSTLLKLMERIAEIDLLRKSLKDADNACASYYNLKK